GVPMVVGERVVGMISVQHFVDAYAYDENDLNILQAIANQAGIALEHARLFQSTDVRLSQRVEELTALSTISQQLNATLEPRSIFTFVLEEAIKVTGAAHGIISMINEENDWLEVRAWRGYTDDEAARVEAVKIPLGSGIGGRAASTGQPALVNDIRQNPDYFEITPDTLSEIVMPIQYAQSVVGIINLESPRLDAFTDDHVHFVEALASQAAIAIGNAQRLEEYRERGDLLRRRAEQLTNLFQIGRAFRTDQPLDLILDDVAHAIQETVGFNVVMLSLLESEPPRLRRVAAAGVPVAEFEEIRKVEQPWELMSSVMQDQFRISQSYYIPMEYREAGDGLAVYYPPGADHSGA
ncbi:MAG TPA: GAF domain-containing protein, partial [Anaerolineae bacterium]